MGFDVYTTSFFEKQFSKLAKRHHSLKEDLAGLIASLESNPIQGMALGKDCYKIRLSIKSKGRGKSGGARVISCVKIVDTQVFLLSIYDKSEKADLSDKELSLLLSIMEREKGKK